MLVHHPYDSFATSVEEFIRAGVDRPEGARHQADALPHVGRQPDRPRRSSAPPSGASRWPRWSSSRPASTRQANIEWATALEEAGVHVVYGLVGLKTHTKIALVVRDEPRRPPPLLPHRHRQLQPEDGEALRGPRAAHRRRRHRRRPHRAVQLPHRLRPQRATTASCSSRRARCATRLEDADPQRGRGAPATARIIDEDELPGRSRADRRALRRRRRPACAIDLVVRGICCLRPGVPASPRTSGSARSSVATSSTRGSSTSPTATARAARLLHRLRRPDAAQPRPARRGARPGRRPGAAGAAQGGAWT